MSIIDLKKLKLLISKSWLDEFQEKVFFDINKSIDSVVSKTLKEYKNKKRIVKNDEMKGKSSVYDVLTEKQIKNLPTWIKKNFDWACIIGNSKKVLQIKDWRKYHIDNKLNDLSGGEWTFFLNSVISTRYTTSGLDSYAHDLRKIHPSPKPPQLMADIIKFFTKENELVFDYFMWVGGTLLGASLCDRRAIWIDLEQKYLDVYKQANVSLKLKEQITIQWDSIKILSSDLLNPYLNNELFSLILIDPPYGNMMAREKTWEAVKQKKDASATPFTNLKEDLGNMERDDFRWVFKESIKNAMKFLKNKWHIVVFIKDIQPKGKNINLWHADMIRDLNNIDELNYLWTKIWADQWVNLYPYWYPYSYVSNQIHQYIIIFKKINN